jgi:hypothetical protein
MSHRRWNNHVGFVAEHQALRDDNPGTRARSVASLGKGTEWWTYDFFES